MVVGKILDFIKQKRGYDYPVSYKLLNGIPLSEDELYVNDYLMLRDSNIKRIPDGFYITGSLDLNNSKIKHLPDNLYVGGYLDLRKTNLKKLPNNMDVGSLYISDTEIDSIPEEHSFVVLRRTSDRVPSMRMSSTSPGRILVTMSINC